MSQHRSKPNSDSILDNAWVDIVGGMEWLKSVFLGEFSDTRPLSAVIADMLVSFLPGVVIVTSARDAAAVILRLANHPEKREELMEWVLLCACLITVALPIAIAAGGAVGAGVGAVVAGIAGSELGAALRAVMLLLIREASKLVDLVRFLQKFINGDVLKFLRAVKFAKYENALVQVFAKVSGKLVDIVRSLQEYLENLQYFETVQSSIAKLAEWERKFYDVQQDAVKQIPLALAELDARLAKVLAETAPREAHTVAAGVRVNKNANVIPPKQRVRDIPGMILSKTNDSALHDNAPLQNSARTASEVRREPVSKFALKDKPAESRSTDAGENVKKQTVADAVIASDRKKITELSNAGKITEAREILQPYVDAAKNGKTFEEREAAMNQILKRLDVTSPKEKMFWSGNVKLAAKIAKEKGKIILEQTPGGRVIDDWNDLKVAFPWDNNKMGPYGWDFWGEVSSEYAKGAIGEIDVIQDVSKFPNGGPTWRGREWPTIFDERKVTVMNIFSMDDTGKVLEVMRVDPYSEAAKKLFSAN